jgi:hypothetical protein
MEMFKVINRSILISILILICIHSYTYAALRWKVERGKVWDSSYYGQEYYALVVCKKSLIGMITPKLLYKGQEILVEYRNTKEGTEYRFYEELPSGTHSHLRYRDTPMPSVLLGLI